MREIGSRLFQTLGSVLIWKPACRFSDYLCARSDREYGENTCPLANGASIYPKVSERKYDERRIVASGQGKVRENATSI